MDDNLFREIDSNPYLQEIPDTHLKGIRLVILCTENYVSDVMYYFNLERASFNSSWLHSFAAYSCLNYLFINTF